MKFTTDLLRKLMRMRLRDSGSPGDNGSPVTQALTREILDSIAGRKDTPRMNDELREAKIVQETLFPPEVATIGPLKIAGYYEPAYECGGDWWFYSKVGDKIYLWIGDATGHGVPAALLTSAARAAAVLLEKWPDITPPLAMQLLNNVVCEVTRGRLFMTFFLAAFDPRTGEVEYCNASHPHPIVIRKERGPGQESVQFLSEAGTYPLGFKMGLSYSSAKAHLRPGDFMFFFTDGLSDLAKPSGLALGERRLVKMVEDLTAEDTEPKVLVEKLASYLFDYRGMAQIHDDITFFVCRL